MSIGLERFLTAQDLDKVAALALTADDLGEDDVDLIRSVLAGDGDALARRNLLLHPEMLATDLLHDALVPGLDLPDGPLLRAAVVGSQRAARRLVDNDRRVIAARIAGLLDRAVSEITRERAAAALVVLATPPDISGLLRFLADHDSVVRHNVRAAIVRTLGARQAHLVAEAAEAAGDLPPSAAHFLQEGVNHGQATNHDLIMGAVLAPQLVPLSDIRV